MESRGKSEPMKKRIITFLTLLSISFFGLAIFAFTPPSTHGSQSTEEFYYKLKLGWFTLGSGTVKIDYNAMNISGEDYHKVFAHASTLGLGNWLSNLDDKYNALIHNQSSKTLNSYKNVTMGDSRLEQWNDFNYDSLWTNVKIKDYRKSKPDTSYVVKMNTSTYGILGTFLYFKNYDWESMEVGDSTLIHTVYENKLYRVGMHYQGLDKVNLNGNKVEAHKMHLLIPDQKKLKKDRPVVIWLSADKNHYPLMIYSKLFIGSARCELHTINAREPAL